MNKKSSKKSSKNKNKLFSKLFTNVSHKKSLIFVFVFAVVGVIALTQGGAESNFSATGGRPFASNSAWNTVVPNNPKIDPNSAAMVSKLSTPANAGIANLYQFGKPVYFADAQTPRHSVKCTKAWGTCLLQKEPIPIPANAKPSGGSDGHMVVVDLAARKSYEFWQYSVVNGQHQTSWGGVSNIDGEGRDGGSIGGGVSVLAGLVRLSDIQQGSINHALAFSTSSCAGPSNSNNFRYPASKTDGQDMSANALPEGSRIQLDPSINVDAIPGISAGEKMVAKALQTYGAYAVDCGGASMGFYFEDPKSQGKPDPYPGIGFGWDYYGMNKIPWNKLRVLDASVTQPQGAIPAPTPPPAPVPNPTPAPTPPPAPVPNPTPAADSQKPTAPSDLSAAAVASSSIDLKWNPSRDNVGVAKYTVWRSDSKGTNWQQIGSTNNNTVNFSDKNLTIGTSYSYSARAVDAAGNISDSSNVIVVTTTKPPSPSVPVADNIPPSAASHLSSDNVSSNAVSLTWGPSKDDKGVVNYNIWRTESKSNRWKLIGKVDGKTTTYTDKTVDSKSSYSYGIRAVDAAGNISDSSNILLVTTPKKAWYYLWWR